MRLTTGLAIGGAVFGLMVTATHAQFSDQGYSVPGIEDAQAQTMSNEQVALLNIPDAKPMTESWVNNEKPKRLSDMQFTSDTPPPVNSAQPILQPAIQTTIKNQATVPTTPSAPAPPPIASIQVGASSCQDAIANAEKKYNLPPYILQAVAITESGREGSPYPWAMNIQGRSYYASGPDEVQSLVSQYGSRSSIDIGCAQINLKWHGHRFSDWRQLLDPQTNADYASYHRLELRKEFGGWSKAVSAYHSRTNWRGANYACKVSKNYGKIFGDNRPGCGPDIERMTGYLYANINR